jgi:GAF domain-containing protein
MADKSAVFDRLEKRIGTLLRAPSSGDDSLKALCRLLRDEVPHYDWVGFYLVDETGENLVLGPYAGKPTGHVKIPFGRGVCGRAAAQRETLVIQDVAQEDNYLSCSSDVVSEIVVPFFKEGRMIGEIDIDSHSPAPFSPEDRAFLEKVCAAVAGLF